MVEKIVHKEILIPKYNEYPLDKGEAWAKRGFTKARLQVDKKRSEEIKKEFPIRTAEYVIKMTFGKWRLTGPLPGKPDKESPLELTLEYLKPYVYNWKDFKPRFIEQIKLAFEAICNSDYKPEIVNQMNKTVNDLLGSFAKEVTVHLDFVLHPRKVEYYYSLKYLELMSRIYEHYTGGPLDLKMYPQLPRPNGPRQMEMHLNLSITKLS